MISTDEMPAERMGRGYGPDAGNHLLAAGSERGKDRMIVLDYRDSRPLYEQVAERLRELMFKGALPQDAQLPSVRSLATELSINPNTIQRAYTELERQGYIYSIKGKGSFVADNSRMKVGIREEWKGHFTCAVKEGIGIGVTAGEMKELIDLACREHTMERGESDD